MPTVATYAGVVVVVVVVVDVEGVEDVVEEVVDDVDDDVVEEVVDDEVDDVDAVVVVVVGRDRGASSGRTCIFQLSHKAEPFQMIWNLQPTQFA